MQPWNQWGVQATSGYTLPGYPAAIPSPVVTAAPTVSTMPYAMGGYQWPSYSATNVTPTVGAGWPVQNQQQQWDQWTQWQQQYAQWQQEYGDKYMQSVQQSTPASATLPTSALPTGVPPTTVTAAVGEKRAPEASTAPGAKKAKTDENSAEAIKDVLKEMAESEKQFDEQFNNWESQFNSWREQNASHPDTEQYKAYEAKWKSWRNQLLQRREQMRKKREAKMTELSKLEQQAGGASMPMPPPTLGATSVASASVTPAMTPAVLPSTALPPPGMAPDSSSPYAMYNPSSFYNQQGGYMFGSSAPYGVAPVFPPVPPPAVVPSTVGGLPSVISQATIGLPPSISSPGQNKPMDSALSANNVSGVPGKSQHNDSQPTVNFNQPPPLSTTTSASSVSNVPQASADGGGIPGLDLLNQPSNTQTSKPPDFNPASTSSLIPKQQEIIQTPADSKPFDFPSPAKNQITSVPPPSMMNFPPPGYLNPAFKVFQMGTNPNPGLLPTKHNPNKELVEALMNTMDPGPSQDRSRLGNQNFNKDRNQMSDMDPKGNNFGGIPPGPGQNEDFRGNPMNNFPTNNYSENSNQWNPPSNKAPLLPTPSMQGQGFAGGKQGEMQMGGNNSMPPFNQTKNDGSGSRFGGPPGYRGNDGSQGFRGNDGPPPGFRGSDGTPQGFKTDGLPPGYRADGPPPNFRNDGPPPNFRNDGPPPNFRNDGPPPNFRSDGPPPNYRNDGPPNYRGQDGYRQNGPPPGFRGNEGPQGQGFRDGPPPGFRGDNFRPNDGPGNFRGNKFRKDDFDRPSSRQSYGEGDYSQGDDRDRDFNEQRSDQGRSEYNEEGYDNPPDDRGPQGNRDFRFPPSDTDSLDRNSFKDKGAGGEHGMPPFSRGGHGFGGPGGRAKSGPQPLMSSGLLGPGPPSLMGAPPLLQRQQQQPHQQQLPPLYSADKIIDYCHKLSNLGVPSCYEPVTMIDYAHGSHKLPEGEEDRFPPSENRDLFPKEDDFDARTLGSGIRGSPPFRSRSDGRRTSSWGRTRESRWEREAHMSSPRREEGRNRDREDRPRDDRRDRDIRDERDRRDDRERESRRDLRRDERRGEDRRGEDRRGEDRRGEDRRGDDRRGEDRRGEDRRGDDRREREDRESPRREERWRHDKSGRHDDDRQRQDDRRDRDRSSDKPKDLKRSSQPKTISPSPPNRAPREEGLVRISPEKTAMPEAIGHNPVLLVDDLLLAPGRERRPPRVVVILRGPPGSGKTFVAKLMKDKEVEMGGSAPRILSLDDYFMVESEKEDIDPETGRTAKVKTMEYEYESGMEPHYRESLVKAFRKTIIDGYFPFIIVDCINDKLNHFEELSSFAKQKSFQVYICEMDLDVGQCIRRNVHKRTEQEINNIVKNWEKTPVTEMILDVRSLLQSASITEVNMEDNDTVEEMQLDSPKEDNEENKENDVESKLDENDVSKIEETGTPGESKDDKKSKSGENEETTNNKTMLGGPLKPIARSSEMWKCLLQGLLASALASKWDDSDSSNNKLDRLDGLSKARRATSIKDWLQLPEDYFETSQPTAVPGKKRVRWADLEERRKQEKMRAIGFVVGQTDWSRMLDPSSGQSKLTQTKYI